LVPRSGSIIGTRTSDSRPTSKITESQLAATTSPPYLARQTAAEVRPGVLGRLGHGPAHLVVVEEPLHRAPRDQPVVESPSPGVRRSTEGRRVAAWRSPAERLALPVALQQAQLGHPVQLGGACIGSRPSRSSTLSQRARRPR
jgi:hypothetical protein